MSPSDPTVNLLLLAGGKSTRMGTPKHLLSMPDGQPLYRRQIDLLRGAFPPISKVYISLAPSSPTDQLLDKTVQSGNTDGSLEIIYDEDEDAPGPSAGLVTAHKIDPEAAWLAVACDHPLLPQEALHQLVDAYEPPVTCFCNEQGFCEPLVGIWGPDALDALAANVRNGQHGPGFTFRQLDGNLTSPPEGCEWWLWDADTKSDWDRVLETLGLQGRSITA